MKVLFFNYEYPPLGGGAGNATSYILKEFSKVGDLELDLVTSSIDEKYSIEKVGSNITIYKVPIGKNKNNLHYQSQKELLVYSWQAFKFANNLTQKKHYDLTHSFFTVPCGALSLWLKITKRIPYIVSLRGSDVPGYSERFSLLYKMLIPLIKYIWKKSFFVVANSLAFKELAKKTSSQQEIKIITNGIDIDEFYPKKNDGNFPERTGNFKIICGSRLTPRKGISFIIDALKILKDKGMIIELDVIGDGNQKEELMQKVKDLKLENDVKFLGLFKHSELPRYYQNANVYVSASLNEGMSNTMLEALAVGLPIIATDTGGTFETVKDGINGYVIKMESATDIAEKVALLFNDYDLEKKMSQESRNLAEKMSWHNIASEYVDLYRKVVFNKKEIK